MQALEFSQDGRTLRVHLYYQIWFFSVPNAEFLRWRWRRWPDGSDTRYLSSSQTPNRNWQVYWRNVQNGIAPDEGSALDLVELNTQTIARTWSWEYERFPIRAVAFSRNHNLMAVTADGLPISLFQFYEPRPDSIANDRTSEAQMIDLLASKDSAAAFDAMCELVRRGNAALPILQQAAKQDHFPAVPLKNLLAELETILLDEHFSAEVVRKWMTQLQHDDYENRYNFLLTDIARGAPNQERPSPERMSRVKDLLCQIHNVDISPADLVANRIVEIAAAISSTESKKWMEELAQGAESKVITHIARATLAR